MEKNNILLIGLGYFGQRVAARLAEFDQDVMAVDSQEERLNAVLPIVTNGRIGDVKDENFIKDLGPQDYDICIVAIGDDFLSTLEATALLKDNGAHYVVSRASSDIQERLLLRNGADEVVFPEKTLANWTGTRFSANHIFDSIPLYDGYSVMEIEMPSKWVGHTLAELDVRNTYHLNIIASKRGKVLIPNVDPGEILDAGRTIIALGKVGDIRRCFQ